MSIKCFSFFLLLMNSVCVCLCVSSEGGLLNAGFYTGLMFRQCAGQSPVIRVRTSPRTLTPLVWASDLDSNTQMANLHIQQLSVYSFREICYFQMYTHTYTHSCMNMICKYIFHDHNQEIKSDIIIILQNATHTHTS